MHPEAEKEFDTVFSTIKAIRSLAAQYNLQSNLQVTILSTSPNENAMLEGQAPTIVALSKGCQSANIISDTALVPPGCGSVVLSPSLTVYLLVKV